MRPTWDERFMIDALNASTRANCLVRHVGAVLAKNNRTVASGYNGAPPGIKTCLEIGECLYQVQAHEESVKTGQSFEILKELHKPFCIVIHAEKNVFRCCTDEEAEGATLYVTCFPCFGCVRDVIVPKKIKRIIYWKNFLQEEYDRTVGLLNQVGIAIEKLKLSEERILEIHKQSLRAGDRLEYRFDPNTIPTQKQ
jgi:dCMP deaminase